MQAVRCTVCGETRWTFFTALKAGRPCEACGGPTVIERRRPGRSLRSRMVERRDKAPANVRDRPA